ncbi:isoprenoid synthase domain-containing protein [Pisolithus marmoratus]|nr:isoprenoid synthase domain-containing protein [Pisolithus marmoratus]
MLVLQSLQNYLSQVLSPPSIHTALLVTPEGALVSYASQLDCRNDQGSVSRALGRVRSKDEVRKVAGLSAEVWAETRMEGEAGMVESELGRILVLAVEEPREENGGSGEEPLLLLVLNGTTDADWEEISRKPPPSSRTRPAQPDVVSSSPSATATIDPHALFSSQLCNLLASSHPSLTEIASYYFRHPSKQIRPLLVLLFSRATNGLGSHFPVKSWAAEHSRLREEELDAPLTRPDVLCDFNPSMPDHTASFSMPFDLRSSPRRTYPSPPSSLYPSPSSPHVPLLSHSILPTQMRLAQIVEMIHVASLLHDDVIDKSPLRRGAPSGPAAFGNKLAVLGGDFLLGRASAAISRLGSAEVVELCAGVIANLVEGEILQMSPSDLPEAAQIDLEALHASPSALPPPVLSERWSTYLRKTYLKTAALMAKGIRAAVVLGGCRDGEVWKEVAYAYGRNLGLAFQLVDDILDFSSSGSLGKPGSGADLRLGLATGPVLYAAEEYPELEPMIARAFDQDGDVERALTLVHASSGVARTRELAMAHADKAREVLQLLPPSDAREGLVALTERVVKRAW